MSRRCERPDCAVVATVGYGFDASQRVAWFVDLASTPRATAGALCRRHAAAMVLPRGWWLDDRRPESASRLFDAADGADGTSLRRPDSTPTDAVARPARGRARRARAMPVEQPALGLDESSPPTGQPPPAEIVFDSGVAVDIDIAAIGAGSEIASDADAELDASVAIASGIKATMHKPSVIEADADIDIDVDAESDLDVSLDASAANEETPTPWVPSFDHADDLDGLLDARSPLLARAFRGRRRPGS